MDNSFYFDARSLLEHASRLRESQRTAQRLHEALKLTKNSGDPSLTSGYDAALDSAEKLRMYFEKMAEAFENAAEDAAKLVSELGVSIGDSSGQLRGLNDRMQV